VREPAVTVIILAWNGVDDTLECLESLRGIDYTDYRTMVVDNGSADGTADAVRSSFPEVEVIETGETLGFAGGNNVGIRRALEAGADAVLLLNNDTTVHPGFLSAMIQALYWKPDIGAVNPVIYYYDDPNIIWSAGGAVDARTGIAYQRHIDETDSGQITAEEDIDYGVGAALLMRREAIEAAGLLDPSFFLYYEETDWCCRARDAGYRTVLAPKAKAWHKVSRGLDGRSAAQLYYFCRNRLYFMSKRRAGRGRLVRIALGDFCRMSAAMALRGDRKSSRAVIRAIVDFYLGRMGRLDEK
jgi:hypothetical protein